MTLCGKIDGFLLFIVQFMTPEPQKVIWLVDAPFPFKQGQDTDKNNGLFIIGTHEITSLFSPNIR